MTPAVHYIDPPANAASTSRLWERWKIQHPTLAPYLPKKGMKELDPKAKLVFHAPNEPAPWAQSWTVQQTLDPAKLGYAYA